MVPEWQCQCFVLGSCYPLRTEQAGSVQTIGIYLVSNFSGFNFTKLNLLSPLLQTPAAPKCSWGTEILLLSSQKCHFHLVEKFV